MNHLFQGMQEQHAWSHEAALQHPALLWKGSGCRCFRIKPKKGTSISFICHTQMRLSQRLLWLVGIWDLAEWGWKWTHRTPRTGWGKPLQKVSWMYCAKGDEKLKVKTVELTIFHPGTKGFLNEEIWPSLLNYSFYLGWTGQAKGRGLGLCLPKIRATAPRSRSAGSVHGWHVCVPALNMIIRTVY